MIFTAAGDADHPVGFGKGPLLQLETDEAKALGDHIYGDIGGVLIPKPDRGSKKASAGQKLVEELTGLWTGLKMKHLELCARQAFTTHADKRGRPGVTQLGFRDEQAPLVCQALRLGLVNHLIIGSALEASIEKARRFRSNPQRSRHWAR
jgi:hypothetical protein